MKLARTVGKSVAMLLVSAVICMSAGTPATATPADVNVDNSGLAILGYDPVAYFEMNKPAKGKPEHTASHKGAVYRFVSDRHRQLFIANPVKYVPAYGGWCSFGMRYGQTSRIDPLSWDIVDGRLYLTLNLGTRTVWQKGKTENITIADRLWQKIYVKN
jgi:YHS domain-containing protein